MSLKGLLSTPISGRLLSRERLLRRRARAERARLARGARLRIDYFHQPDDPYSLLAAGALPDLVQRYDVDVVPHGVGAPQDAVAPERERLVAWSRRDAALLARRYRLDFRGPGTQPDAQALADVTARQVEAADAAREAFVRGIPFGRLVDPVGRPVERGLALLHRAQATGLGDAFLLSFMRGTWAEGLDAGSDRGLRTISECAGLSWSGCREALADTGWRAEAERNRVTLFERGLWGVPAFAVGETAVWGQDRLWAVVDALEAGLHTEHGR